MLKRTQYKGCPGLARINPHEHLGYSEEIDAAAAKERNNADKLNAVVMIRHACGHSESLVYRLVKGHQREMQSQLCNECKEIKDGERSQTKQEIIEALKSEGTLRDAVEIVVGDCSARPEAYTDARGYYRHWQIEALRDNYRSRKTAAPLDSVPEIAAGISALDARIEQEYAALVRAAAA